MEKIRETGRLGIKKFPTQIMKQSERVWKWSIEANDGRAWIFFIFAACRWLPTVDASMRTNLLLVEKNVNFV